VGSLKSQVVHCLKALEAFGQSRHEALKHSRAPEQIFSARTMQHYCALNVTFGEWCYATFHINRLGDVTSEMAGDFISHLRQRGLSPATINTYVCAIRKLDSGLRHVGWRRRDVEALIGEFHGRRADVVADPYSLEDSERLILALEKLDPQFGAVARLQRVSGLRISEAVHLQAAAIAPDGGCITLEGSGTHAKGGRPRSIPILLQHQSILQTLREQGLAHADGHIFCHRQSLTDAIKRAASRLAQQLAIESGDGTHSFRKLYANELYQHLQTAGHLSRAMAQRAVTEALGHGRLDVLKAYLIAEVTDDSQS
jgi:integrase